MKLTLKDVIFKGIEAHKAGKIREADQFYTSILNSQPDHPDANHNMGVLAVGIGKVEEAIPYFIKAIKSNEKIEQFWVSYIDALVKLQKLEEAVSVYQEACEKGINGEKIENIKKFISANPENDKSLKPIFIIGMPRSGTTLVEQILSSHKKITGAGELDFVRLYGADIALGEKNLQN